MVRGQHPGGGRGPVAEPLICALQGTRVTPSWNVMYKAEVSIHCMDFPCEDTLSFTLDQSTNWYSMCWVIWQKHPQVILISVLCAGMGHVHSTHHHLRLRIVTSCQMRTQSLL